MLKKTYKNVLETKPSVLWTTIIVMFLFYFGLVYGLMWVWNFIFPMKLTYWQMALFPPLLLILGVFFNAGNGTKK